MQQQLGTVPAAGSGDDLAVFVLPHSPASDAATELKHHGHEHAGEPLLAITDSGDERGTHRCCAILKNSC